MLCDCQLNDIIEALKTALKSSENFPDKIDCERYEDCLKEAEWLIKCLKNNID